VARKLAERIIYCVLGLALLASVVATMGYEEATSTPVVRRLRIVSSAYPDHEAPIRIALLSDLHVHGPDMPPARVHRLVDQVNNLHADIDIAAGDFIGDNWIGANYSIDDAIRPLSGLRTLLSMTVGTPFWQWRVSYWAGPSVPPLSRLLSLRYWPGKA